MMIQPKPKGRFRRFLGRFSRTPSPHKTGHMSPTSDYLTSPGEMAYSMGFYHGYMASRGQDLSGQPIYPPFHCCQHHDQHVPPPGPHEPTPHTHDKYPTGPLHDTVRTGSRFPGRKYSGGLISRSSSINDDALSTADTESIASSASAMNRLIIAQRVKKSDDHDIGADSGIMSATGNMDSENEAADVDDDNRGESGDTDHDVPNDAQDSASVTSSEVSSVYKRPPPARHASMQKVPKTKSRQRHQSNDLLSTVEQSDDTDEPDGSTVKPRAPGRLRRLSFDSTFTTQRRDHRLKNQQRASFDVLTMSQQELSRERSGSLRSLQEFSANMNLERRGSTASLHDVRPPRSLQDGKASGKEWRRSFTRSSPRHERKSLKNLNKMARGYSEERNYRIVMAGDAAVGKSSFILRLCTGVFHSTVQSTLGVDFHTKSMEVDGKLTNLQLWDTAGQERFRSMARSYFRRADGVLLLYDCTDEQSFIHVRDWISTIEDAAHRKVPIMLCGNKTDLKADRKAKKLKFISTEEGYGLAETYDALFTETSAKDGSNVLEAVMELAGMCWNEEDFLNTVDEEGIVLSDDDMNQSKKSTSMKCCL